MTEHRSFEHLPDNQLSAPRDLIELRYIDRQHELLGMFPLAEAGAVVTERLFLLERLRSFPDLHPGQRFLSELVRHRGAELDVAGDGFFARFDGPARAVRCARAITDGVRDLGLEVRAGLHTGECELIDGKVGGIAVHIGARIAALAQPGEVLVSSTVKDIVAGSGIAFDERGEHALAGVPGTWRLFAAQP